MRENNPESGSTLVIIIGTIVVVSLFSAFFIPSMRSALYDQLNSLSSQQAAYLAESGYRYAASEYANGSSFSNKLDVLSELHNQTISLADNDGNFTLQIYSHFSITNGSIRPGATEINGTEVPGSLPSGFSLTAADLDGIKIGKKTYQIQEIEVNSDNTIYYRISPSQGLPKIDSRTTILPVVTVRDFRDNVLEGDDLVLSTTNQDIFSSGKGYISIKDNTYRYQGTQTNAAGNIRLLNLQSAESGAFPLELESNDRIQVRPCLTLNATGRSGDASRKVAYPVTLTRQTFVSSDSPEPVDFEPDQEGRQFTDPFDRDSGDGGAGGAEGTPDNWRVVDTPNPEEGSNNPEKTEIKKDEDIDVGGYNYLSFQDLNATYPDRTNPFKYAALLLNNSTNTGLAWQNIRSEWRNSNGYLGYTVQMKQRWNKDLYYAAGGISFRWHASSDDNDAKKYSGYGISIMRYKPSTEDNDMIPDSIKPDWGDKDEPNNKPLLVLWKQNVNEQGRIARDWLAYKDISKDPYIRQIQEHSDSARDFRSDYLSLVLRVEEKKSNGFKFNEINVYYGDASDLAREPDECYSNFARKKYNVMDVYSPSWTDKDCLEEYRTVYFTRVHDWTVNPDSKNLFLNDHNNTIVTTSYTTPDIHIGFGDSQDRPELGVHVFGDIGEKEDTHLRIYDLGIVAGSNSTGQDQRSSFSRL